jgi:hypothetical protein
MYKVWRLIYRSQWPGDLRRGSAASRLQGWWVRIPPVAWMSLPCVCCVLSAKGLFVRLISRPEESYRVWCVWVWSRNLDNEETLAHKGLLRLEKGKSIPFYWHFTQYGNLSLKHVWCFMFMDTVYSIQYLRNILVYTGLLKLIVGVLTTCHTQHTWDRSICIFLFNRTTLQVFVTYVTGALYVNPLWFYKHQHDNQVCSKLFVACQRWWFQWRFWFVPSVPSGEMHNYCTPHITKENFENFLIHRCNYILLSQVYCVWQVVKTPTIICYNPVLLH